MKYTFHPAALEEYRQAANWYAEREQTVAIKFITSIEDAIERVSEAPTRWRIIDEDVRRCLARVFSLRNPLYNRERLRTDPGGDACQPRTGILAITTQEELARVLKFGEDLVSESRRL